jgi:hypothetical protein
MAPTDDDAQARRSRAARLREEIARRKSQPATSAGSDQPLPGESAREFVERRQRELAEKEKSKKQ